MDRDRKREIIAAEFAFENRERLARALAESGVYVLGDLPSPPPDLEIVRRPFPAETGREADPQPGETEAS